MPVYRVKIERVVKETVTVLVEAKNISSLAYLDPVVRASLVDHADNYESWDGENISQPAIVGTLPCREDVTGKPVFDVSDPKHMERRFTCCEKLHTVKAYMDADTGVTCPEVCAACPECGTVYDF